MVFQSKFLFVVFRNHTYEIVLRVLVSLCLLGNYLKTLIFKPKWLVVYVVPICTLPVQLSNMPFLRTQKSTRYRYE